MGSAKYSLGKFYNGSSYTYLLLLFLLKRL